MADTQVFPSHQANEYLLIAFILVSVTSWLPLNTNTKVSGILYFGFLSEAFKPYTEVECLPATSVLHVSLIPYFAALTGTYQYFSHNQLTPPILSWFAMQNCKFTPEVTRNGIPKR